MKLKLYIILIFTFQAPVHADIVFMGGIQEPCHITIEELQEKLAASIENPYKSLTFPEPNCQNMEIYYQKDKDARSAVLFKKRYEERKKPSNFIQNPSFFHKEEQK